MYLCFSSYLKCGHKKVIDTITTTNCNYIEVKANQQATVQLTSHHVRLIRNCRCSTNIQYSSTLRRLQGFNQLRGKVSIEASVAHRYNLELSNTGIITIVTLKALYPLFCNCFTFWACWWNHQLNESRCQ